MFASLRERGRLVRHVVIAGANPEGRELAGDAPGRHRGSGYRVLGFVDDTVTDPSPSPGVPLLGTVSEAAADRAPPRRRERDRRRQRHRERDHEPPGPRPARPRASTSSCPRRCATSPRSASPCVRSGASRSSTSSRCSATAGARIAKRAFDIVGATVGAGHRLARCSLVAAIAIKLDIPRPGAVQAEPGRPQRPSRSRSSSCARWCGDAEAQLDRPARRQRGRRPAVQDQATTPGSPGSAASSARTSIDELPAALERAAGRDEPGRPPAGAAPRDRGVGPAAHPAPAGQAGHHRHVAGQRPQRDVLRGLHPPRPLLRRQLVAAHRPRHPGQDGAGGA